MLRLFSLEATALVRCLLALTVWVFFDRFLSEVEGRFSVLVLGRNAGNEALVFSLAFSLVWVVETFRYVFHLFRASVPGWRSLRSFLTFTLYLSSSSPFDVFVNSSDEALCHGLLLLVVWRFESMFSESRPWAECRSWSERFLLNYLFKGQ